MLKRRISVPVYLIVVICLALTGVLFAQEVAFAQGATPAPAEEAPAQPAATPAPAEEAPAAEPTPTAAPAQQAAPAEEAAPAEATPSTMPTTGVASDPLTIIWVVVGTVVVLGTLSAYSSYRKRTTQG
jgi:uncharacterized iron-regulated membrane protein